MNVLTHAPPNGFTKGHGATNTYSMDISMTRSAAATRSTDAGGA